MPRKRVLVTGAAGFIGSHTVDHLLKEGHAVLGVDDLSTGNEINLADAATDSNFALETADVSAPGVIDALVGAFGPDVIIHLAALVSVPRGEDEPRLNYRLNIHATHEICEAARARSVKRVVFASSAAVYGECDDLPLTEHAATIPVSQYGYAKRISEQILASYGASYGIETARFRYFNVYGPRQDPASPYSGVVSIFCDRYRAKRPVTIFGNGRQSRDFVYVGDVARANTLAATIDGSIDGVFNCCTGVSTSLLDLVAVLDDCFPGVPSPSLEPDRSGDIRHSLGDASAIRKAIGYSPVTPFQSGLRQLLGTSQRSAAKP